MPFNVEGFETQVLKGSYNTLLNFKPALFIELDNSNLKKQNSSAVELCNYLTQIGYNIYEEGKNSPLQSFNIYKPINIYCTCKKPVQ